MKRLTEKTVKAQLVATKGNYAAIARALGVTRSAVWQYIRARPGLAELAEAQRHEMVDNAETALAASVINRDPWAVQFVLKTLGKDRGYVERQELTGANGNALHITIDWGSNDDGNDTSESSPGTDGDSQ